MLTGTWLCLSIAVLSSCGLVLVSSFSLVVAMVFLPSVGSDVLYCDILFKLEFLKAVFDLSIQPCWISPLSSSSAYSKQARTMFVFGPKDFSSQRQDSRDCMWQHVKHERVQLWRSQTFTACVLHNAVRSCVTAWPKLHDVLHYPTSSQQYTESFTSQPVKVAILCVIYGSYFILELHWYKMLIWLILIWFQSLKSARILYDSL